MNSDNMSLVESTGSVVGRSFGTFKGGKRTYRREIRIPIEEDLKFGVEFTKEGIYSQSMIRRISLREIEN